MTIRPLIDQICQDDHELINQLTQEFRFDSRRGPYDLVEQGRPNLLVTIGDSWTFGTRLAEEFANSDQGRLDHCYGQVLANALQADFLNLAIPATNNLWMARHYTDICKLADQLDYKNIWVFITLTEFGREICTNFDLDPALNDRYRQCRSAADLAHALAEHTADVLLSLTHAKVKLALGINYVDNIYPERIRPYFVPRTWLECCLDQTINDPCLVVGSWALDKFKLLPKEFNSDANTPEFLQECVDMIDQSQQRLDLIYNTGYNHKQGYGHPNSKGHEIWANYIQNQGIFG
jgi:lysophospholipase L1-like esterase